MTVEVEAETAGAEAGAVTPSERPFMRGRLHEWSFFMSLPMGVALVATAAGALPKFAAIVYAASLAALFGTSALYHRITWSPRARAVMRRLDHSMIFVLIAGTYTPFCLLVLHGAWGYAVLATVWAGAVTGILLKTLAYDRTQKVGAALYIILGWVVVLALPKIVGGMSVPNIVLLATGGVLYTVGAVILFRRRPDPSPRIFGYHEIFHSMVLGAGLCHYVAVLGIVSR